MGKPFGALVAPRSIVWMLVVLVGLAVPVLAEAQGRCSSDEERRPYHRRNQEAADRRAVYQTGLRSGTDRSELVAGGASGEQGHLPCGDDRWETLHRRYSEDRDRPARGRRGD